MANKNKWFSGKKRLINFTGEQDLMLRIIAQETGLSISSIVRLAVESLFATRDTEAGRPDFNLPIDASDD